MTDRARHLLPHWASYRRDVMPACAGPVQIEECRRAFFAGAAALLCTLDAGLTSGEHATPADVQVLLDVQAELVAEAERVERSF